MTCSVNSVSQHFTLMLHGMLLISIGPTKNVESTGGMTGWGLDVALQFRTFPVIVNK